MVYNHTWHYKKEMPERRGQPCRVLVGGGMHSTLVEFGDGYQVVTSRHAVRRHKNEIEKKRLIPKVKVQTAGTAWTSN